MAMEKILKIVLNCSDYFFGRMRKFARTIA